MMSASSCYYQKKPQQYQQPYFTSSNLDMRIQSSNNVNNIKFCQPSSMISINNINNSRQNCINQQSNLGGRYQLSKNNGDISYFKKENKSTNIQINNQSIQQSQYTNRYNLYNNQYIIPLNQSYVISDANKKKIMRKNIRYNSNQFTTNYPIQQQYNYNQYQSNNLDYDFQNINQRNYLSSINGNYQHQQKNYWGELNNLQKKMGYFDKGDIKMEIQKHKNYFTGAAWERLLFILQEIILENTNGVSHLWQFINNFKGKKTRFRKGKRVFEILAAFGMEEVFDKLIAEEYSQKQKQKNKQSKLKSAIFNLVRKID